MSKPFKLKSFIKSRVDRVRGNIEGVGKRIGEKVEKVDKFLKNVEKGDFKMKSPDIKKKLDWKYGHGEFADIKKRRKPGESKFKYDVRMREQGVKTPTVPTAKETSKNIMPDPKSEIKNLRGKTSMTSTLIGDDPLGLNKNPGDLRFDEDIWLTHNLPSAPGDEWTYEFKYDPTLDAKDEKELLEKDHWRNWENAPGRFKNYQDGIKITATNADGDKKTVLPGSKAHKAILKRYTGSETGDISSWKGYDTKGLAISFDDPTGDFKDFRVRSKVDMGKKSYLPYDLAQKYYNPNW